MKTKPHPAALIEARPFFLQKQDFIQLTAVQITKANLPIQIILPSRITQTLSQK
jgi:hypothetical protein